MADDRFETLAGGEEMGGDTLAGGEQRDWDTLENGKPHSAERPSGDDASPDSCSTE